jgi:fermentation-respiration switch protein FrsA (DUF1100 family)
MMLVELPMVFHSQGVPLVGRFFRNTASLHERQPVVIAMGSWLTVKEQMATTYARRLAEAGYTTFVFDFAGFGESRGEPRQAEIPARKIGDIAAAVQFLQTVGFVDPERIGCLAICASAQYTIRALSQNLPVRSFVSVAGWYHDPSSVAPFYGGDAGVALRLDRGRAALERYARTGEEIIVPAYKDGDDRAGMYFTLDYYGRSDRGAIAAWKNEMAEMTWLYWLTFDGLSAAGRVSTPTLLVHGDGCVFPEHVRQVHDRLAGPKDLVWTEGSQIDFYDQPDQVATAVQAATNWFDRTLRA